MCVSKDIFKWKGEKKRIGNGTDMLLQAATVDDDFSVGVNFMVLTEQFTGKLLAHEFE
jgi:hypothetical protein